MLAGACAVGACGGNAPTASASPTVPGGCNTPSGFVFTDGSAHANVSGTTRTAQVVNVSGAWSEPFETSRPNNRFDPGFRGAPWLNVDLGSATNGVVVEVQGQDPCALSPDGSHSYVAIVFGRDAGDRYGGKCSVTVDAFNNGGFRGRFSCTKLQQFNSSSAPTIDAQGTFSATGHVYTPTAAPTATPSQPTAAPATPTPAPPTPTPTPAVTPTSLTSP